MDFSDRATEQEEEQRARSLAEALTASPQLPAVGQCYNCLAPVPPGVRFCDADCRDDYETRRSAEIRRGRAE